MKRVLATSALLVFGSMLLRSQTPIPTQELLNVFPADAKVDQFVLTGDGQRTYYTTTSGEIWLYDRDANKSTRVTTGTVWDLAVSPTQDALVYTKGGETRRDQNVWMLRLDPKTGLALGSERRVGTHSGDGPSISPDGKWIAFARDDSTGVGQSVVVVPIGGGAERVVANALPSSVGNIRWTPDGKTLYFGVNPPVPFTCAESCLSVPGGNPQIAGTIRRVPVAGGAGEVVATTGNPAPGLTPDGTMLVFAETGGPRQFAVADASGRRLNTFTIPPSQILQGWSGKSTLLTVAGGTTRRLRTMSVTGGPSRLLFETDFAAAPAWSPDGKMVSLLQANGDRCELRIMDSDGKLQKAITLPDRGCGESLVWTPDQRSLVYTQYFPPDGRPVITTVEVATGQTKQLRTGRPGDMRWVLDSDAVIVSEVSAASEPQHRVSFSQVDLDGKTRLLRELPFDEPSGSFAISIDRSTAIVMRASSHDYRVIRLDRDGAETVVLPARTGYVGRPTISIDKQWIAFPMNPALNDPTRMRVIELVRLDGTARHTVDLPFSAQGPMVILPGAKELIVVERFSPDAPTPGVYRINVETRSVQKLFDFSAQGRLPEMVISADARTLLALITERLSPSVTTMDLSHIR